MKKSVSFFILGCVVFLFGCDSGTEIMPSLHIDVIGDEEMFVERNLRIDSLLTIENGLFEFDEIPAMVRGRGNSTWNLGEDKRPLRFRLDEPVDFFGDDRPDRDWILLANNFDRSLLRNHAALYLGGLMSGLEWTPRTQFLHLYVNGEYMGVYQLTDEREETVNRLNLVSDVDPTISEFFLELDGRASWDGAIRDVEFFTAGLRDYDIRYPDPDDDNGHAVYAKEYIQRVSDAIMAGDFETLTGLIDMDSFVDFYLVQELVKNIDVWHLSVFMYIRGQGEERRLFLGPLWDFDLSAGNARRTEAALESYRNHPHSPYSLAYRTPYLDHEAYGLFAGLYNYWFYYLLDMPEFRALVRDRWNDIIEDEVPQMLAELERMVTVFEDDFLRNFERHPILGIRRWRSPDHINEIETHEEQVNHLLDWFDRRIAWLTDYFNE